MNPRQPRGRQRKPLKAGRWRSAVGASLLAGSLLFVARFAEASDCERAGPWAQLVARVPDAVGTQAWERLRQLGDQLVQICPESARGHYWRGVALFNSGQFFAAVRSLRASLRLQSNGRAHLALAQAYSELGQKRFAREEFLQAKKLDPSNPSVHFVEGKYFYEREHRLDLAEAALREALDLRSDHAPSLCYLAMCLSAKEQEEEAERALLRAVRISREQGNLYALPHELLAELYIKTLQPEVANRHARRAVGIDAGSTKSQFLLGKTEWMLEHPEKAVAALEKAIALDQSDPAPRFLLGQVLLRTGQHHQAELELEKFHELEKLYGRAQ